MTHQNTILIDLGVLIYTSITILLILKYVYVIPRVFESFCACADIYGHAQRLIKKHSPHLESNKIFLVIRAYIRLFFYFHFIAGSVI